MTLNLDKSDWKHVTLGEVIRHVTDRVDPQTSGLERFLAGEHIPSNNLGIREWGVIGQDPIGPMFYKRFQPGHVLYVSRRSYLRKTAVPHFTGICGEKTFVLETINQSVLLQEFLPFLLSAERFHEYAIAMSRGSVNPYINWTDIAAYEFDLPPLDEQKRIANLLWAIEWHRQRMQVEGSKLAVAYETWVNNRMAGLPTLPLQRVVQLQPGRPVSTSLYGDDGMPLLRPGDMKPDGVTAWTDSTVRVPVSYAEENSRWILSPGDLVINMTAQSLEDRFLGRVCRVCDTALLNQRIGRMVLSPDVNADFLHIALRASAFSGWVARKSEGSKVKHMHWRHIQDYPLPLPDLLMQESLVEESVKWSIARDAVIKEIEAVFAAAHSISNRVFGALG
jgi:type I restriction enzyme S subunit